jgi:hypothetical protein
MLNLMKRIYINIKFKNTQYTNINQLQFNKEKV